jgi:hypothetical protein
MLRNNTWGRETVGGETIWMGVSALFPDAALVSLGRSREARRKEGQKKKKMRARDGRRDRHTKDLLSLRK